MEQTKRDSDRETYKSRGDYEEARRRGIMPDFVEDHPIGYLRMAVRRAMEKRYEPVHYTEVAKEVKAWPPSVGAELSLLYREGVVARVRKGVYVRNMVQKKETVNARALLKEIDQMNLPLHEYKKEGGPRGSVKGIISFDKDGNPVKVNEKGNIVKVNLEYKIVNVDILVDSDMPDVTIRNILKQNFHDCNIIGEQKPTDNMLETIVRFKK